MRIEAIDPSYYTNNPLPPAKQTQLPEITNISGISEPEPFSGAERYSVPRQTSLYNPAVVVDISPEGWEASRRNKTAGTPQITAETGSVKKAADVFEPHICQTCKNRKYQDGSNDPSVSFQAPTHIAPNQAASAVASHEGEHVAHEQAKAKQEDRKIVSQTVSLSTSICPECGRVYISGGVTRTITAKDNSPEIPEGEAANS